MLADFTDDFGIHVPKAADILKYTIRCPLPVLLSLNRESRAEGLKVYSADFGVEQIYDNQVRQFIPSHADPQIYVN